MAPRNVPVTQSSKPSGWLGRLELLRMNRSHSAVTDWGLHHISIRPHDTILDIGCGGGRTIAKLAEQCTAGKV
jgi:cyclopropane fatty-acyl-phospholipid synthase-like methyltransferase